MFLTQFLNSVSIVVSNAIGRLDIAMSHHLIMLFKAPSPCLFVCLFARLLLLTQVLVMCSQLPTTTAAQQLTLTYPPQTTLLSSSTTLILSYQTAAA
mmetsp:Transcript_17065/g.25308  ORF Transcript_17065/g.25308 Transcript_17065/m.25308 type:complete len:97 (-) Transcript_17065:124-414(-)